MRVLLQRVKMARVLVDGELKGQIGEGLVLLVGVRSGDTEDDVSYLADKCVQLRIFGDEEGKMNLSAIDVGGEILAISQFTLHADTRKGRRPSFVEAAGPEVAERLYDLFVDKLRGAGLKVETGVFGAHMLVEIHNDGPVTIMLESPSERGRCS